MIKLIKIISEIKIISKGEIKAIFDFAVKDCNVFKIKYEKNIDSFYQNMRL